MRMTQISLSEKACRYVEYFAEMKRQGVACFDLLTIKEKQKSISNSFRVSCLAHTARSILPGTCYLLTMETIFLASFYLR